jgi:hypothetical protein
MVKTLHQLAQHFFDVLYIISNHDFLNNLINYLAHFDQKLIDFTKGPNY